MLCKNCGNDHVHKNGKVRFQQRYKCKECGFNFVEGDKRSKPLTAIKRAFAIILYSLGKASYGFIAKLFNVTPAAVLKWIRKEAKTIEEPEISCHLEGIEFDEMWHFVQSKKTKDGLSKPWIELPEEPLPGLLAIVMLPPFKSSMIRSST